MMRFYIKTITGGQRYFGSESIALAAGLLQDGEELYMLSDATEQWEHVRTRVGLNILVPGSPANAGKAMEEKRPLQDALEHVAELHWNAAADARNTRLTAQQRKAEHTLATVWLEAWAMLWALVHPKRPYLVKDVLPAQPDGQFVSLRVEELQVLLATAQSLRMPADEVVHLRVHGGYTEAFVVGPQYDNGGQELLRQPATPIIQ